MFRLGYAFYFLGYRKLKGRGKKATFIGEQLCAYSCFRYFHVWPHKYSLTTLENRSWSLHSPEAITVQRRGIHSSILHTL